MKILTQLGEQEAAEKTQAVAEDETTTSGARAAAAEATEQAEAQVCYYRGVLVPLYMRPSTNMYVSSYRTTIATAAEAEAAEKKTKMRLPTSSYLCKAVSVMAGGKVWCVTVGMCASSIVDGRFFDTCPIATKRGCSCRTSWMTKVQHTHTHTHAPMFSG